MKNLLKRMVASGFGALGLEIRRKGGAPSRGWSDGPGLLGRMYSLRWSMAQALEHVVALGFAPATVIDVGVASGTPALYTSFPQARHLLVEPLKEFEEELRAICRQYKAEYVLAAAGARRCETEIGVNPHLEGSSLLGPKETTRRIPVVTLDEICKERGLKGPYVVKVDVQGAELQVLEGAPAVLKDTELVILEVSFFRFREGCLEFHDVIDYMKKRGFVAYEMFDGHNRPLDGARAQVDVAFVKEEGWFRTTHAWATPEQVSEFCRLTEHR